MEEEATKRRNRLRALAATHHSNTADAVLSSAESQSTPPNTTKAIKFRNYEPLQPLSPPESVPGALESSTLDSLVVNRNAKRPLSTDPSTINIGRTAGVPKDTVETMVADVTEEALAQDRMRREQPVSVNSLAPQKPNWDLKRDLQKKMDRLEAKTQQAIAELIRQRVQQEAATKPEQSSTAATGSRTPEITTDLADVVNAQAKLQQAQLNAENDFLTE
ncbi:hypothetical protein H4R34_004103 [Dimargaris verticillata]|uniref:Cwf18 pre-mRNA splicing factor-domain-containing protein n=1 Tax=Dimargaris verticillata TaxID=2761393 RepID=A0A9W8B4Y4_9FUNG|nr:hypothetical protein H4R34_004103 [Dimargaris verticillata]